MAIIKKTIDIKSTNSGINGAPIVCEKEIKITFFGVLIYKCTIKQE